MFRTILESEYDGGGPDGRLRSRGSGGGSEGDGRPIQIVRKCRAWRAGGGRGGRLRRWGKVRFRAEMKFTVGVGSFPIELGAEVEIFFAP
jgi:hypothetical protein